MLLENRAKRKRRIYINGMAFQAASIVFKVIGDVKEMGEPPVVISSTPVLTGKNPIWHFNVKLDPRFKELSMVVDDAGDGIACDHANWANPGFLK